MFTTKGHGVLKMNQSSTLSCLFNSTFAVIALVFFTSAAIAQQPVILGASGFGINTPAGRGGEIVRVTNLADSGSGSLRNCIEKTVPRVCVFEVSGVIRLSSSLEVRDPYLTIAGQTAPNPGIMLRGAKLSIRASDVLVQHLALRTGDDIDSANAGTGDGVSVNGYFSLVRNVVIDHCSVSWTIDEVADAAYDFDNITWSNNIFSEPLHDSIHPKGVHGYGPLIESANGRMSLIGNLLAHAYDRNPRSGVTDFVFVNNVVYDAESRGMALLNKDGRTTNNSVVGNVFRKTPEKPIILDGTPSSGIQLGTQLYLSDNVVDQTLSDQWSLVHNDTEIGRAAIESSEVLTWPSGLIALPTSGDTVLNHVLNNAGARPAARDAVDARIMSEVRNRSGQVINCVEPDGTSRCEKNGGGWPQYAENQRRLTLPDNPNGDDDQDGYTNLEEWLHALAAEVEGVGPPNSVPPSSVVKPNPPVIGQAN